jgi:hypothetical protein
MRAGLAIVILVTIIPKLRAEITIPFSPGYNFDSLTVNIVMNAYADDPWGSFYGMYKEVTESTEASSLVGKRGYIYSKSLTNHLGGAQFNYLLAVGNTGVFAPSHWLPEWHKLYNSVALAQVFGTIYADGSGRLVTYTEAAATPGGSFFPNWPAAAQLSGAVTLNGSPGEGTLHSASYSWVRKPPPYGTGSGAMRIYVDGLPVISSPEVVDVDSTLAVSFTNSSFLHKFTDYNAIFPEAGLFESLGTITEWGFDEMPGQAPTKPTIGIVNETHPDQEVFTCIAGLTELFFISGGSLQENDELRSAMSMMSQPNINDALFRVIEGGSGFASLRLPNISESTAYTISIGGQEYDWDGTTAFDFLTIDPQGVERFRIAGPGFGSFAEMPLFSMTFAATGIANFTVAVPELPSALLAMISMGPFLFAQLRRKRSIAG